MDATQSIAVHTASAILRLSKVAWKLGVLLTKLDYDSNQVDTTIKNLSDEVKSLSVECDLVYAEIEDRVRKHETGAIRHNDDGLWSCIALQVDDADHTMQELELLIQNIRGGDLDLTNQVQLQRVLEESGIQITSVATKIYRHTDVLRTVFLLVVTAIAQHAPIRPGRPQPGNLDKLQNSLKALQTSSPAHQAASLTSAEASLVQCAHELMIDGYNGAQNTSNHRTRFSARNQNQDSERRNQEDVESRDTRPGTRSGLLSPKTHAAPPPPLSAQRCSSDRDTSLEDSDDEFEVDLARAALDTGDKSLKLQDWNEAHSLLQEALRIIHQLPIHQRTSFSIFDIQYKLAICAYHTKEAAVAEEALLSFIQQPVCSDRQREIVYDSRHRLSQLYIQKGDIERAHIECEKALQGRRRLLGKQNSTTFESIALMARIYVLRHNRALAKSYLAMIPEENRDTIMKTVEESLGKTFEHLDFSTLLSPKSLGKADLAEESNAGDSSTDLVRLSIDESYRRSPTISTTSGAPSPRQHHRGSVPPQTKIHSELESPRYSIGRISERRIADEERLVRNSSASLLSFHETPMSSGKPIEESRLSNPNSIPRKEILEKIGCHPRDRIEEAVCSGDYATLSGLLGKKKDSWRLKLRKNSRSERVTALHFAALFGEIEMARVLLTANYNINEIPFGYSTSLPPLKFAIGARQVDMVVFLLANGAKPSEPDTWSTLAGQLLSRSWLMKTMSEAERDYVPAQVTAILSMLLKYGWKVNTPFDACRSTLLHQAVTFWSGSFAWDVNLRVTITSFLCEAGANPFQRNAEGQTPYDQALATGHQDLVSILGQYPGNNELDNGPQGVVELAG